jgi:hypothetical protein
MTKHHHNSAGMIVALAVLVFAGVGHRLLARRIDSLLSEYLQPKQPLAALPFQLASWTGRDIPLDEQTRRMAGDDDFLNREYVDAITGRSVSLCVGYIGRPRSRLGHRPDVCYPAHGYRQVSCQTVEIRIGQKEPVPALLYRYTSQILGNPSEIVLATYVINGHWVTDTALAGDYNTRGPALFARQVAFVARVQLSMRSTGDDNADTTAATALAYQLIEQIKVLLPE